MEKIKPSNHPACHAFRQHRGSEHDGQEAALGGMLPSGNAAGTKRDTCLKPIIPPLIRIFAGEFKFIDNFCWNLLDFAAVE